MAARFKTFTAGAVLTASEVNTYLAKQAVISCDDSSDYPAAPVEGMVVYDVALDAYLGYTGSAWRAIASLSAGNAVNVSFAPSGNLDNTAGTFTDWITMGSVTVPSWAIRAKITLSVSGIFAVTNTYFGPFRAKLGTVTGNQTGQFAFDSAAGRAVGFTIPTVLTVSGSGSQSLIVQAQRDVGSGTLRADTSSRAIATVEFLGV